MTTRSFITRELDVGACVRLGTMVRSNTQKLLEEGALDTESRAKVKKALLHFLDVTDAIDQANKGAVMPRVDRGTDRCVAGLFRAVDGITAALHESPLRPLSEPAKLRLATAELFLEFGFPNGTSYLTLEHEKQWEHLRELEKFLKSEQGEELTNALGLQLEVEAALDWIKSYGEHKGITSSQEVDRLLDELLVRWHDAYEKLAEKVKGTFDDDNPEEAPLRALFLSPYLDEVEKIRKEDRARAKKYREAKKAKKDQSPS